MEVIRGAEPRRQIVGHRCQMLGQAVLGGGTPSNYTRSEHRIGMYMPNTKVRDLQVAFAGWYSSNGDQPNPASLTIDEACEIDSTFMRFKFAAASSTTLSTAVEYLLSDIMAAHMVENELLWLRGGAIVASGSQIPQGYFTSISGEGFYNSTAGSSQIPGTGPLSLPSGGEVAAGGFGPVALIGHPMTPVPAVYCLGDSIGDGLQETPDSNGNKGPLSRGLYSVHGGILPQFRATRSGDTLALNTRTNAFRKRSMARFCTHLINQNGSNTIASGSIGAIETYKQQFRDQWTFGRAYGLRVAQCTITTRTTSTDVWATTGGQTVVSNFQVGGLCDQINDYFYTAKSQGLIDDIIEVRPYVQDSNNLFLPHMVGDLSGTGTHLNNTGSIAYAQAVNATALTW